jgi:hypothetical protein
VRILESECSYQRPLQVNHDSNLLAHLLSCQLNILHYLHLIMDLEESHVESRNVHALLYHLLDWLDVLGLPA